MKLFKKKRVAHAEEALQSAKTPTDKLRIAIESDLLNLGTHLKHWQAMTEILFSFRNDKGALIYSQEAEDSSFVLIRNILLEGQKTGEFGGYTVTNLAIIIDAARDTFLTRLTLAPGLDLELFIRELTEFIFIQN